MPKTGVATETFQANLPTVADPQIRGFESTAVMVRADCEALVIQDDASEARAVEMKGSIKQRLNQIETRRKEFVDPLNKAVKGINAFFKKFSEPLEDAYNQVLAPKLLAWNRKKEEAAEEERRRKQREFDEQTRKARQSFKAAPVMTEALLVPEVAKTTVTDSGAKATVAKVWKCLELMGTVPVADIKAVPPQFLQLNGSAINAAIRDGVREIPGLTIKQVDQLR